MVRSLTKMCTTYFLERVPPPRHRPQHAVPSKAASDGSVLRQRSLLSPREATSRFSSIALLVGAFATLTCLPIHLRSKGMGGLRLHHGPALRRFAQTMHRSCNTTECQSAPHGTTPPLALLSEHHRLDRPPISGISRLHFERVDHPCAPQTPHHTMHKPSFPHAASRGSDAWDDWSCKCKGRRAHEQHQSTELGCARKRLTHQRKDSQHRGTPRASAGNGNASM